MARPPGSAQVPSLPLWRLLVALASVPGVYVTLLASAVLALGIAAGLIAGIYYVGDRLFSRVPAGVLLFLALGGLYALFAVLVGIYRSLRPEPTWETALMVSKTAEPALHRFIEDICAELDCRVPDAVLLSAEPSFHVQQGKARVCNGRPRGRLLTIGCPLLGSLTVSELRAILAHEFAHFIGRDTLYSAFVLPVYVSIGSTLGQMETVFSASEEGSRNAGCMSVPMIVPALVLRGYIGAFHRLNASLSRLRETRADMIAAEHAGSDSFSTALKKVAREGALFTHVCPDHIMDGLRQGKAFANYYEAFREAMHSTPEVLDDIEQAAMADIGGPEDFHPPLQARLQHIPEAPDRHPDSRPARALLAQPDATEERLTAYLTSYFKAIAEAVAAREGAAPPAEE